MPKLTLNQAAREVGKAKKTILDAIRAGKLTAPTDDQGRYQIDPSELFRVWPPTPSEPEPETKTHLVPPDMETALLRQKVEMLEQANKRLEQAVEDLREDRDQWRKQATHLITHQTASEPRRGRNWHTWALMAFLSAILAYVVLMRFQLVESEPTEPKATTPAPEKHFWEPPGGA